APQLNPYPGKKSVVILDNCSIHHDEELRQIIVDECGECNADQPIINQLTIDRSARCTSSVPTAILTRLQSY
ncbi:hypothetical protein BJ138DRAFT_1021194, partial [Hygrophoropsis aurantiaca]